MKKTLPLLLVALMIIVSACSSNNDFSRLMAGETIHLEWSDKPLEEILNMERAHLPQAYQVINSFIEELLLDTDHGSYAQKVIFFEISRYAAPQLGSNEYIAHGGNASSIRWDHNTNTLFISLSRQAGYDPYCGGQYGGDEDPILITNCVNGYPSNLVYHSGVFTVIYEVAQ
jgi:hypothetical protein